MAKIVRARAIKLANKLPYKQFHFSSADDADDAQMRTDAADNVQSTKYESALLDDFEIQEVPYWELVTGNTTDAKAAVDGDATQNARLRRLTFDLDALKSLMPTALSSGNFKVAVVPALPAGTNNIGKVTPIETGAANFAANQVTVNAEVEIVAARSTRRRVLITNHDGSINVFIGGTGVLTTTGFILKPGATQEFKTNLQLKGIPASGSPVVSYFEEYD